MDKVATKRMLKDLDSDNIKNKTKDYSTLDDMMEAFYAGEVDFFRRALKFIGSRMNSLVF